MRRAELPVQPDGEHIRLITRNVDLRNKDDMRLESRGQRAHQLAEEFTAGLGVDDANQLGGVLAAGGSGCQLRLGGQSLGDLLAQLRVGLLQREIAGLEALLVLTSLEFGTRTPREDPQNLEVDFAPVPLARIEHRQMAAHPCRLVANGNRQKTLRADADKPVVVLGEHLLDVAWESDDLVVEHALARSARE